MTVLAAFGLFGVLVLNVLRAMWLRNAIDKTAARRDDEAAALGVLRREFAQAQADVGQRRLHRQNQLNRVEEAKQKLDRAKRDRVEFVHEIGEPGRGLRPFRADLSLAPGFAEEKPEEIPFNRDVWKHRNVADIWASSAQAAAEQASRAFPATSGVVVAGIVAAGDVVAGTAAASEAATAGDAVPETAP